MNTIAAPFLKARVVLNNCYLRYGGVLGTCRRQKELPVYCFWYCIRRSTKNGQGKTWPLLKVLIGAFGIEFGVQLGCFHRQTVRVHVLEPEKCALLQAVCLYPKHKTVTSDRNMSRIAS